ncbi:MULTISPECIES: 2TM domain-containing protein [Rhizobium/Agrobacterium group]|jgi:transcriptional regulator with XRE-family HTH domain|uniref:2TM domain-containing protein n=1 Tax=Rhizobium/Agrobacterium group TaxID=227290 RepID=UPI002168B251|nr:2TM domain-containing protein [Rhizobium sp. BIGb0125]MCS4240740.1 transcriptional regulator with XRE-family HTH domain [Rhizobium sp. BIGb0125]
MLIQKLRLQRGWSQEQLATISGLSTRTIQRLERGQPASLETMNTLAAVFEVDLSQLTDQKEAEMPNYVASHTEAEEAIAFAKVRRIKKFYLHLIQYVVVLCVLTVINLLTNPGYFWVIWPALGWGIALASHALKTFELIPFLNADWEKKQVENHLGRKL